MTKVHVERIQLLAVLFALATGLAIALLPGFGTVSAAAPKQGDKAPKAEMDCGYLKKEPNPATAGKVASGINFCRGCHNGGILTQGQGFVQDYQSDQFILLNESQTWDEKDAHAIATIRLKDELGMQMQEALKKFPGPNGQVRGDNYRVTEAPECLTCHSVDTQAKKPLREKQFEDFSTISGGVDCTACHGLNTTWRSAHVDEPRVKGKELPWRKKTPEEKFEHGMTDVRNPVVKAQLCASCHVGSQELGRVVTHEMYAAGHPPLPPFELATYLEGQPKHWAYPTELPFFATLKEEETWPLFHFHPAKSESYLSRNYAVGAIAALRAEAEMLRVEAVTVLEARKENKGSRGIDFARFDCGSCHHDLKENSDRQKRGYDGPPGRPPLRAAVAVSAGVVAKHAMGIPAGGLSAKSAGFEEKWDALRKAAVAKPFGDPAKVEAATREMIAWCDGFFEVQCHTDVPLYSPDQAIRLREMIAEAATGKAVADPEAAACLAWAYTTLSADAKIAFPPDRLSKLGEVIPISIRSAPFSRTVKDPRTMKDRLEPIPAQFGPRMTKMNAFGSAKFTEAFRELGGK